MNEENAKQLIELIKAQSNVKIGQGVISGNTLSIDGVSGEIVGKCQGDNVLLRGEDGQWYGFIDSGEEETQVLSSKTIRNYKRQAPVDKDEVICFLIDVSNSIEMDGVNRCMTILNNQLEGQFKRLTNQKIIILPFADSVYTPNTIFGNTLTRQKAIVHLTAIVTGYDSLEDKFDRYDPSVFIYGSFGISESDPNKDTLLNAYKSFWINEGTDLSENGIDGIASAIALFKSKSTIYLITDNEKYSRNETSIETLQTAIVRKLKKLFIQVIEPINQECLRIGYVIYYDNREEVWLQTQIGEEVSNQKLGEYYYDTPDGFGGIFNINVTNLGSGENDYVVSYLYSYDYKLNPKKYTHPNNNLDTLLPQSWTPEGCVNIHVLEGENEYIHELGYMGYDGELVGNGYVYRSDNLLKRTYGQTQNYLGFTDSSFTVQGNNQFLYQLWNTTPVNGNFIYHLPVGLNVPMNSVNSFLDPFPSLANQFDNLFEDFNLITFDNIEGIPNFLTSSNFIDVISNKPTSINPFLNNFVAFTGIRISDKIILGERFNNNDYNSPYKTIVEALKPNVQYKWYSKVNGGADLFNDNFLNINEYNLSVEYAVSDSGYWGASSGTSIFYKFNILDHRNNHICYWQIDKDNYSDNELNFSSIEFNYTGSTRGNYEIINTVNSYYNYQTFKVVNYETTGIINFPFNHQRNVNINYKKAYSEEQFDTQFNNRFSTISPEYKAKVKIEKSGNYSFPLIVGNTSFIECEVLWQSELNSFYYPQFILNTSQSYSGYVIANSPPSTGGTVSYDTDNLNYKNNYYFCSQGKRIKIDYYNYDLNLNTTGYGSWKQTLDYYPYYNDTRQSDNLARLNIDNGYSNLYNKSLITVNKQNINNLSNQDMNLTINFYDVNILPLGEGETEEKCRIEKSPLVINYPAKKLQLPEGLTGNDAWIYSVSYYIPQELKQSLELNFPAQLVVKGQEQNPYCSTNSSATALYLNNKLIGKYSPNSNILRQIRNYLLWRELGANTPFFSNFTDTETLSYQISLFEVRLLWDSKYIYSYTLFSMGSYGANNPNPIYHDYTMSPIGGNFKLEVPIINPQINFYNSYICNYQVFVNNVFVRNGSKEIIHPLTYVRVRTQLNANTGTEVQHSIDSVSRTWSPAVNLFDGIDFVIEHSYQGLSYYHLLERVSGNSNTTSVRVTITSKTPTTNRFLAFKNNNKVYFARILDENSLKIKPIYKLDIKRGTTTIFTQYIKVSNIESLSTQTEILNINNNLREIEQTDEVKVICEPSTQVEVINIPSELYQNSLPPSDKIIYL